jgi:hypothetical protein
MAKKTYTNIMTPVGRLVSGSLTRPLTKDGEGRPLVYKKGANAGQPRVDYRIGLAIRKDDPGLAALMATLRQVAATEFPGGQSNGPTFAWKYTDGDSQVPNGRGNKPCDREGFPGHLVFWFSGSRAPQLYDAQGKLLTDGEAIKPGHYLRVSGSVAGNEDTGKPGLYLNHSAVQHVAYGPEISLGFDEGAAFAANPVTALPPGATATPPAPAGTWAPQPAPDFLRPQPSRTHNGAVYTHEQLRGFGWTDAQIAALPLA